MSQSENPISKETEKVWTEICNAMSGGKSFRRACEERGLDPGNTYRSIMLRPTWQQRYAQAQDLGADMLFDTMIDIAQDESKNPETRRLTLDALKFKITRQRPERYSERMILAGDKSAPLQVESNIRSMTDEQLRQAVMQTMPSALERLRSNDDPSHEPSCDPSGPSEDANQVEGTDSGEG